MRDEIPNKFYDIGEAQTPKENNIQEQQLDKEGKLIKNPDFEERDFAPKLEGLQKSERWKLEELIGQGTNGWVYRAYDEKLGLDVAIKIQKKPEEKELEVVDGLSWKQYAQREAMYLAELNHPCVPKVYDFGIEKSEQGEEFPFIVQEYFSPDDFEQLYLKNGYLDPETTINIFEQVTQTVDYMAEKGIYHFDIQPANILLPKKGSQDSKHIKLLDFGLANVKYSYGSPGYNPPEADLPGLHVRDLRSEVYSIAAVAYETLTGGNPFDYKIKHSQELAPMKKTVLKMFCDRYPEVDYDELLSSFEKSFSEKQDDRYQTATEFFEDFKKALS